MDTVALEIAPCSRESVERLVASLRVSEPLAQALVRRGHAEPSVARAFLAAGERHDEDRFDGLDAAVETIARHARARTRVTVHGDYDVDGVCSTAILVSALRRLGAQVDWRLPERAEGYGLREQTIHDLAARGTRLLITADCGVASVAEVALARSLGIDVVVSDHHSPRADGQLPDAPIVHPAVCGYPCTELCATAVAHKLTRALWRAAGRDESELDGDLDLVALATVADVVQLAGENRRLLREGLVELRRTARPGLRALAEVARVELPRIDERAIGFGLAPRINAVGRLYSPAAALELLLTEDRARAAALAAELDRCNRERRATEREILSEAEAQVRELGPLPGYVLAGERWHHGVVGIVAARIAEQQNRPAVLVALERGRGRGSGRSIPAYDLLAGLTACAAELHRYGGHAAAAGVELERSRLPAFREAFAAHAEAALGAADLAPRERVDAIVGGRALGLPLAEELGRLAPFGRGNPEVSILVRDCRFEQIRPMGEGRHVRFQLASGGVRALGVCFGRGGSLPVEEGARAHATFKLEVNEWRGACEPRLVLRHVLTEDPAAEPAAAGAHTGTPA
ncbi:MAG: single-stranded-DNA-specific exonuclease RecJ, partial [Solirubrobacteraceae bacterium]